MAKTETVDVRINGVRPLLMHRMSIEALGDRQRGGGRPDPKAEAKQGLYIEAKVIGIPALNILAAMREAGKAYKVPGEGRVTYMRYIYAGVEVEPMFVPLVTNSGKAAARAWTVDVRPVTIQKARVARARPRFDDWALEFKLNILDPKIRPEALKSILEDAGRYVGLCDMRPLFGLFSIERFQSVK